MKKGRTLVIDDEREIGMLFSKSLPEYKIVHVLSGEEGLGKVKEEVYDITTKFGEEPKINTATDGRSTIKIVEQGRFDIVILNIHLPDMNGIEVLKKIQPTNHIPNTGRYL